MRAGIIRTMLLGVPCEGMYHKDYDRLGYTRASPVSANSQI